MNPPALNELASTPVFGAAQCAVREVMVLNANGVHIQPAAELVALAGRFRSTIRLIVNGQSYGTGSILDILSANLTHRKLATLIAEGPDAEAAATAVGRFLAARTQLESPESERRSSLCGVGLEPPLKRVA